MYSREKLKEYFTWKVKDIITDNDDIFYPSSFVSFLEVWAKAGSEVPLLKIESHQNLGLK